MPKTSSSNGGITEDMVDLQKDKPMIVALSLHAVIYRCTQPDASKGIATQA
nr:hypothetical protein [uncultured Comamonas sp.]